MNKKTVKDIGSLSNENDASTNDNNNIISLLSQCFDSVFTVENHSNITQAQTLFPTRED